jgi:hypothetical protein
MGRARLFIQYLSRIATKRDFCNWSAGLSRGRDRMASVSNTEA